MSIVFFLHLTQLNTVLLCIKYPYLKQICAKRMMFADGEEYYHRDISSFGHWNGNARFNLSDNSSLTDEIWNDITKSEAGVSFQQK